MRINTNDLMLKRNYLQTYRLLIKEYKQVKAREHPHSSLLRVSMKLIKMNGEAFLSITTGINRTSLVKNAGHARRFRGLIRR